MIAKTCLWLLRVTGCALIAGLARDSIQFIATNMDWYDWKVDNAIFFGMFFVVDYYVIGYKRGFWAEKQSSAVAE